MAEKNPKLIDAVPVKGKLIVDVGVRAVEDARRHGIIDGVTEGYKRGLADGLERALKRIDGLGNGAQCTERIAIILAHVQREAALPGGGP